MSCGEYEIKYSYLKTYIKYIGPDSSYRDCRKLPP